MKGISRRRAFLTVFTGYVVVVVMLIVVATALITPRRAAELKSHPEAHLYYPGAVVLNTCQEDEGPRISIEPSGGPSVAADLAASAPQSTILAWYDKQLRARGWSRTTSGGGLWGLWIRWSGRYAVDFQNPLCSSASTPPSQSTAFAAVFYVLPGPLTLFTSSPLMPLRPASSGRD